jgi:hypothetical protein
MTKFLKLIIVFATGMTFHSSYAFAKETPFTSQPIFATKPDVNNPFSKIIHFTGEVRNGKFFLNWQVDQNEKYDQFIVEKSIDGKIFFTAALVFTSEKTETENYEYYEQAKSGKFCYRLIIVEKNKTTYYSDNIEINNSK